MALNAGKKLIISNIFYTIATLFILGSSLQSFLLSVGFSEKQVANYLMFTQIVQSIALFLGYFIIDRIKNIKAMYIASKATIFILLAVMLFLNNGAFEFNAFPIFVICGMFVNLFIGFVNIMSYIFPVLVVKSDGYGKFVSLSSIIANVSIIAITFLISLSEGVISGQIVMNIAISVSMLALLFSLIFIQVIKVDDQRDMSAKKGFSQFFKNFWNPLLFCDVLRGLAMGVVGSVMIFASKYGHLTVGQSTHYVTMSKVACLLGGAFVLVCVKKNMGNVIMASCLIGAVLMPIILMLDNLIAIIALGLIFETTVIIEGQAVPIIISQTVKVDDLGKYTAKRMLILTGSTAISSMIVGLVIDKAYSFAFVIVAAILHFAFGFGYFLVKNRGSKNREKEI